MMRASGCSLTDKDLTYCYGMSKMSVINEAHQSSKIDINSFIYRKLQQTIICRDA